MEQENHKPATPPLETAISLAPLGANGSIARRVAAVTATPLSRSARSIWTTTIPNDSPEIPGLPATTSRRSEAWTSHQDGDGRWRHRKRRASPDANRNSVKASSKSPAKGLVSCAIPKRNFVQTPQDIFVTPEIVRRFGLRDGMWIHGETRRGNRGPQLTKLLTINGEEPTKYQGLRPFEELTTINPNKRIKLETVPGSLHHADHGFDDAARHGPARIDRGAAAHRQDDACCITSPMPS